MTRSFGLAILLTLSACALALRSHATPPYCTTGFLVRPGEYMGSVGILLHGGVMRKFPLIATDSVCLRRPPVPFTPEPQPPRDTTPDTPVAPTLQSSRPAQS